jgi:prolipoprotein diacylglyceryl transferase
VAPTSIPSPSTGVVHLGPLPLRAYAFCIIVGVVLGVWIGQRRAEARGMPTGTVGDMAVWAVPAGLVGARLYHVVTSPGAYFGAGGNPVAALYVWRGGLGIWGGVAAGALAAYAWTRRHGVDFLRLADACAPGIAVAQAVGRIGNYFNQELFGGPTSLPWGLRIDPDRIGTLPGVRTYQPTFLYELLWDLGVAGACVWAERRWRLRRGQTFALYVALYTLGRGGIESLRVDPATMVLGLRINVWVSIAVCLAAVAVFAVLGRRDDGGQDHLAGATEESRIEPAPPAQEPRIEEVRT